MIFMVNLPERNRKLPERPILLYDIKIAESKVFDVRRIELLESRSQFCGINLRQPICRRLILIFTKIVLFGD